MSSFFYRYYFYRVSWQYRFTQRVILTLFGNYHVKDKCISRNDESMGDDIYDISFDICFYWKSRWHFKVLTYQSGDVCPFPSHNGLQGWTLQQLAWGKEKKKNDCILQKETLKKSIALGKERKRKFFKMIFFSITIENFFFLHCQSKVKCVCRRLLIYALLQN